MLPGFGTCCHYCAFGVADVIMWTQHCIRESAQDLYLDGNLKLAGFEPLPSEMDRGRELEAPPPAMQICGFTDGKVTLSAKYHKWEEKEPPTWRNRSIWCASAGCNSKAQRKTHTIPWETEAPGRAHGEEPRCKWLCPGRNQKCGSSKQRYTC